MTFRQWLSHFCPFKHPKERGTITPPPAAARLDFEHATSRLTGVSLDHVDASEFAKQGAVEARDRVRQAGERTEHRMKETPVMRAVNEAADQIARSRSGREDA